METNWPFADPEDTEVITLERILLGESPFRLVTHDADDGSWQFLDGGQVFEDDGSVIRLEEALHLDPSLAVLADLPQGWYAWRITPGEPWQRAEGEPPVDLPL